MNNEITPLGVLGLLDTTKAERKTFVEQVVGAVAGGHIDPVKVHLQVKCMEEICKAIKAEISDEVLNQARYYSKTFEFHNAVITMKATACKYDFSNDAEWCRLKDAIKARETYLKGLPKEGIERVTADGEVVTDYPPVYTPGDDTLFVTLK